MRTPAFPVALLVLLAGCFGADVGDAPSPTSAVDAGSPSNGTGSAPPGTSGAAPPPAGSGGVTPPATPASAPPTSSSSVVVAVVDSGINPYHADFRDPARGPAGTRIAGFPADAGTLALTFGSDYRESAAADEATWDAIEVGKLYTIPGTRIAGAITLGELGTALDASSSLILDDVGHGTGTSSAVARASPNADLVMVQVGSASLGAGIAWAAAQPWIDVVSVSWGVLGNAPTGLFGSDVYDGLKAAADAGKLVLVAAGNEPSLAATGHSGPSFVISVGGSSPDGKGETSTAAKGVDVVSDYSPVLATHTSTSESDEMAGTSFATPTVAGALAEALWLAREDGLAPTAAELRAAMNGAATYYGPTDYAGNPNEVPVLAPWVQMGYGYVDGTHAAAIKDIATGAAAADPKPEAELWMSAVMAARQALWG